MQSLTRLLELEKNILGRRLHPEVREKQCNFAGVSADAAASCQEFVARMRYFLENENGNSFEFPIKINFDRLSATHGTAAAPNPKPPTPPAGAPKKGTRVAGECLIMAALVIVGVMLPFPILLVLIFLVWGVWLLGKAS